MNWKSLHTSTVFHIPLQRNLESLEHNSNPSKSYKYYIIEVYFTLVSLTADAFDFLYLCAYFPR